MRNILLVTFLLWPISSFAHLDYSGVYQAEDIFYSVHHANGHITLAVLETESGKWQAYEGPLSGATAIVYSVFGSSGTIIFEIEFSGSTVRFNQISCTAISGAQCQQKNGSRFTAVKII